MTQYVSNLKRANIPYIAEDVYQALKFAPGATPPTPPPVRKSRRNMKLELADAEIRRCVYCGAQHCNAKKLCSWCEVNPFPTIDDLGRKTV